MTAHSTVESALDAMRHGAYDFVTKPFSPAELTALAAKALGEELDRRGEPAPARAARAARSPSREPLGTSAAMQRILELIAA